MADARCLNPIERQSKFGPDRIKRLVTTFIEVAGEKLVSKALCFHDKNVTKYEIIDEIKRQYKEYQTEVIPENFAVTPPKVKERQNQQSYWRNAYKQLNMPLDDTCDSSERIDCYWVKVE